MISSIVKKIAELPAIKKQIDKAKETFEDVTGIKELKNQAAAWEKELSLSSTSPQHLLMQEKEEATARNEPWVAVLDTKFDPENVKHGFFELDWNDCFISYLIQAGYGTVNDPQEEIVDRWFRDIAYQMFAEGGQDPERRGAGIINIPTRDNQ